LNESSQYHDTLYKHRCESIRYYDDSEFRSVVEELRTYIHEHPDLDHEVGIVVLIDDGGLWTHTEFVHGTATRVDYDFSQYFSNPAHGFPQGTVHYHPYIDFEENHLPSIGDLKASAEMARHLDGWFVCGVVNHRGRATLTFVHAHAERYFWDGPGAEFLRQFHDAAETNDRHRVLQIEQQLITDMLRRGLIFIRDL